VDAFKLTRDRRYAEAADRALKFVLSGEDNKVGGGLYWHEKNREAKNTCANAPGAVAALLAAKAGLPGKRENEAAARRLRDWTRAKLQDPADGLYWDNVKVADGRIDKMKWSYNSALPIRLELLLGDKREAMRVADSSAKHWFDPAQRILKDDASFAHLLAEALLIADSRRFRPVVAESLDTLWARVRRPDGSYPKKWEVGSTGGEPEELLWVASNARAYAFAAGVLEKKR
jgi:hypothetical protein